LAKTCKGIILLIISIVAFHGILCQKYGTNVLYSNPYDAKPSPYME
jgi:hypothetical protein